jgi:hypothetical protein
VSILPLADRPPVDAARWPAAAQAGELLAELGAQIRAVDTDRPALRSGADTVDADPCSAAEDWAQSGAMALTGYPDGAPLHTSGRPASLARGASLALRLLTAGNVNVDGAILLSERAATLGLRRNGRISSNGSSRLLEASDGWVALSLPRTDDMELVPALIEGETGDDPWAAIADWARANTADSVVARADLLGLAAGPLNQPIDNPLPWRIAPLTHSTGESCSRPTVINLGSLWAAPLCGHLLAQNDAHVIDVESPGRPDGARLGSPAFYQLLHSRNTRAVVELAEPAGREELRRLICNADVIVTGSRGDALRRLGLAPERFDTERPRVWVHITGHGMASTRIAFGDDAAIAGGLAAWTADGPVFAGDAIADPLTGLLAALATTACLQAGGSWQIQLSLRDVAGYSLRHGPTSGQITVRAPRLDRY